MKYIDIYQYLRPFELKDEINGIICVANFQPCSVCGHPTCYAEINYEGYFCSEECLQKFEDELWGKK
jgi:hypothetical protein